MGLEPMTESFESGALSLSCAARHIYFYFLRRICVALVAHSIALFTRYKIKNLLTFYNLNIINFNKRWLLI